MAEMNVEMIAGIVIMMGAIGLGLAVIFRSSGIDLSGMFKDVGAGISKTLFSPLTMFFGGGG